jgi:hypothetical protein
MLDNAYPTYFATVYLELELSILLHGIWLKIHIPRTLLLTYQPPYPLDIRYPHPHGHLHIMQKCIPYLQEMWICSGDYPYYYMA